MTGLYLMANIGMAWLMVSACSSSQVLTNMKVTFTWTHSMPLENIHTQMVLVMRENSIIIRSMAMGYLRGQAETNTKDPSRMT